MMKALALSLLALLSASADPTESEASREATPPAPWFDALLPPEGSVWRTRASAIGATFLISLAPAAILPIMPTPAAGDVQPALLCFASGSMLGDVFLHILPHTLGGGHGGHEHGGHAASGQDHDDHAAHHHHHHDDDDDHEEGHHDHHEHERHGDAEHGNEGEGGHHHGDHGHECEQNPPPAAVVASCAPPFCPCTSPPSSPRRASFHFDCRPLLPPPSSLPPLGTTATLGTATGVRTKASRMHTTATTTPRGRAPGCCCSPVP